MYRILHLPALLLSVLAFAFPAQAQVTTIDFNYTGSSQAWVVPTGVNAVLIKAWGAQGGGGGLVPGGRGGYATGLLAVTPGQTLNIYVGGAGLVTSGSNTNVAGGFNGGGQATRATSGAVLLRNRASGGGASDVRLGGVALTDRVIVGAGGGGYGGAGGGLNGVAANGGGGTQASGGAGGSGCSAGSLGQGGEGSTAGCSGGGGGYYGGGSGNTGGGGSSFLGGVNNGFTLENIQEGNGFISISYGEGLLAIFDDQTDFINSAVSACVDSVSGISSEVLEDFESYSPGLYNSGFTGNGFSVSLVESGVAAGNIEVLNIGSNVIRIQPDTLNFGTTGEDLICLTFDEPVTSVGADFILTALNLLGHEGLTLEAVLTMMDGTVEILNLPAGGPLTSLNISAGYLGISDRTGCNKIAKLTFRVSGLDPILNPGQLGLGLILDNLYFNSCDCTCRVESCHDQVNISLDGDCSRPVSALDVMTNVSLGCSNAFNVSLTDQWGNALGNTIGLDQVGQKITYRVTDPGSGNSCWGYIKVEDKYPPQILCVNDTISCFDLSERAELTVAGDNCFYDPTKTNILEKQWIDLGCDDREFIGYMARRIRASDIWGNFNECRDTLFVRKETIDSLVCGTDTTIECTTEVIRNGKTVELLWNAGKDGDTYLDAQGYAHPWPTKGDGFFPAPSIKSTQTGQEPGYLLPGRTDNGPDFANTGKCQIVFTYDDHIVPTCGRSYKIRRTWHVYDWCGHQDTTCVQWFKITDTESPEIKEAYLHSTDDNGGSNCDEVPLSLIILAREKNAWLACGVLEAEADPHDCKATVILPDPRAWVLKDCDDQLEVFYEIEYIDPGHPGKTLLESGTIPEGGTAHVYLPAGWHNVLYHIRDRCWNETLLLQGISVYDNTPPTPVCDEITQVTLDPKECWARVYAKDLDDGSHDNCCQQLHFAVANRDSVTYWRNYWHEYFLDCVGHSDYYANQDGYDTFIEEWINTFVFDDYIDVTECGSEQLVLRVYEACDLPVYDPHTFFGGEHEWYWYNHSILFQVFYLWKLDEYIHYGDPRFYYLCNNGSVEVDLPIGSAAIIYSRPGGNPVLTSSGYDGCNFSTLPSGSLLEYLLPELKKIHVPVPWGVCSWNIITNEAAADWKARVFDPYRTEAEITKQLNLTTPYYTPVKYSDCMIEVLKDDKTPPVVVAPEDVTVYCDGVPYWWELTKPYAGGTKTATVKGHGASFTHDVCEGEDALQTYCSSPDVYPEGKNTSGDLAEGPVCCVEIPWDGGDYGYYGGPVCGEYGHYGDGLNCDGYSSWYSEHNWQPIYCRLWLMLDKYDNPDGGHPDPQRYFDETAEDWVITDNCWAPDTDVAISGSLNECGVGTLTKTVTATDKCGNTSHDTQTLYVKPRSDFEVIFPEDVVVNCTDQANLAADRTGAGYPEISDDDCELIGVTYSDERYDVTEGCYKILRTWKLIDWCVYSPDIHHRYPDVIVDDRLVASEARCCIHRNLKDDGDGYMTYLQVIKVVDDEAPVIVCNDLDETCIYDYNCDAATVQYELLAEGTDNCANPEEIQYRYTVLAYETTPVAYGQGHVLNDDLAVGDYGVWLVGKDRCGNEDSCYTTFTIRDCKKPTPYCYDGISTVVMSPSGQVEVWASDFDAGSYDNCTLSENLILSFTEDGETPSWTYTCADIPDGRSQEIQVTVWVIDEAGNKDFCTTTFILQDNSGNACPDNSPLTESGVGKANLGQTEKGQGLKTPELYQNTPNPFSGETMIGFWLPESTQATLRVMNVTGKELYRVSGSYSAGNHQLSLEAGSLPEVKGVLFYQLETKSGVMNKRMVKVN